jgi:hypothetical protein
MLLLSDRKRRHLEAKQKGEPGSLRKGFVTDASQMLDYDAARSKVRKLQDKPSDDSIKLPRVSRAFFV